MRAGTVSQDVNARTTAIRCAGAATAGLLLVLAWDALRGGTFPPPQNPVALPHNEPTFVDGGARQSSAPYGHAATIGVAGGPPDLCSVMADAGAERFGRDPLQVFVGLRGDAPGAAAVRARRCSFRSYGAPRDRYQDLQVAVSAHPEGARHLHSAIQRAQSDAALRFAVEGGIGAEGFSWIDHRARTTELYYLLADGRWLTVRWAGEGIEPQVDLPRLREFAARLAPRLESGLPMVAAQAGG